MADIVSILIEFITGFVAGIASAVVSTAETLMFVVEGDSTTLTVIGIIILAGIGLSIAFWVIDKVVGLLKFRNA